MAKLTVRKKGYTRKGYIRKGYCKTQYGKRICVGRSRVKSTRVPASTFKIKDRGKPGRSKKVIPKLKMGALGVKFTSSASARRRKLANQAKRLGERKVVGRLRAIQVLNKRTNPKVSRQALADSKWVAGSFRGRRKVKYPSGFGRSNR